MEIAALFKAKRMDDDLYSTIILYASWIFFNRDLINETEKYSQYFN